MGQSLQTRRHQDPSQQRAPEAEQAQQQDVVPEGNQFAAEQLAAQQAREQGGQGPGGGVQGGPQSAQEGGERAQAAPEQEEAGPEQAVDGGALGGGGLAQSAPQGGGGGGGGAAAPGPSGGGGGGGGGAGSGTLDDLAAQCVLTEDWGTGGPRTQNLEVVGLSQGPLNGVPAQGVNGPVTPGSSSTDLAGAGEALNLDTRRGRANEAVTNGLVSGGQDALIGMGMELGGTLLARQGPVIAARGGTMGARLLGGSLGSAVPIVGGVFAAMDLAHQVATIQEKPWGSMFSDIVSFLDCIGTVLQIVGDVVGIVASILAVAGVITAIAGVGFAIGGIAATMGMVGLAISALGMVVQGAAAAIRYHRIVSGQGDPAQVEAELLALEQNVSMATGQAGNLVSHGANTMLEGHIDMRSRVDAANVVAPGTLTGTPAAAVPTTGPTGPLGADGPANTFTNQTYASGETSGTTYTTRLFGNNELRFTDAPGSHGYYDASPTGQFLAEGVPQNLASARQESALPPEWNPAGSLAVIEVAPGTAYHQGPIAPVATPAGGVPTAYPHGPPAGSTDHYSGGGNQGFNPRAADYSQPGQSIVDVMPFDPNIGGWRPNFSGRSSGALAGQNEPQGTEVGPECFPEVSSVDTSVASPAFTLDWDVALADAALSAPPVSTSFALQSLPPAPHNPAQMAEKVPLMGRMAARAGMLDAAAQTGEAYAAEYDRALGPEGPYAQIEQETATTEAEMEAHTAVTQQKDASIAEGESSVATLEAEEAKGQEEKGKADSGSGAVDTVVGLAGNSLVRGLVSVGTGVGGAIAGGVNAVGGFFGADEPVIDTSSIEQIQQLMAKGPELGTQYGAFKSQGGGFDSLSAEPRSTVDAQRASIETVKSGDAQVQSDLETQKQTQEQARADLQTGRDEAVAEAETQRAEAEAALTAQAAIEAQYLAEAGAVEAWSAEAEGIRQENQNTLGQARAQHNAPALSPEASANLQVGLAEIADLRSFLSTSGASLSADCAAFARDGQGANGMAYPAAYHGRAQGIVSEFQGLCTGDWMAAVDRMEADLNSASPDQIGTVVAAIQALATTLHAGVDAAFAARRQAIQDIYFHWEGMESQP